MGGDSSDGIGIRNQDGLLAGGLVVRCKHNHFGLLMEEQVYVFCVDRIIDSYMYVYSMAMK